MRTIATGALYFTLVFAVGFLLGVVRVLWLEPLFAKTVGVLIEVPILMVAMVFAARFAIARCRPPRTWPSLAAIGALALGLQQAADIAVGVLIRSMPISEQLAQFGTPAGLIYATALIVFAAMPLIVGRR